MHDSIRDLTFSPAQCTCNHSKDSKCEANLIVIKSNDQFTINHNQCIFLVQINQIFLVYLNPLKSVYCQVG